MIPRVIKLHLFGVLLSSLLGSPGANAGDVILIGNERVLFSTLTGDISGVTYPCGFIPRRATGPNYDVDNEPYFDGPIAPISYLAGSTTKLHFNASVGYKNYRVTSTLTGSGETAYVYDGELDCNPVYTSSLSASNSSFTWAEWLYGTYRDVPSGKVYAVVYNEYYGGNYGAVPPTDNFSAYSALGLAVSSSNGASFQRIQAAPNHIFLRTPELRQNITTGQGYGWWGGVFKSPLDQLYYAGSHSGATDQTVLMRTSNLENPNGWYAWNGAGFNVNVPPSGLNPAAFQGIGINPLYLGYSDYFKKYIAVTLGSSDNYASGNNLIVYNLSDDLVHWGPPRKIMYNPACGPDHYCEPMYERPRELTSYPSIMDPGYLSDTSDSTKASNGMTGMKPVVTYIKNFSQQTIHQQFATQKVSFENVVVNRMDNFSMRAISGAGNQAMVMGFFIQGSESKQFVFRALSSSLPLPPDFGYPKISSPRISLYDVYGNLIASNLRWTTLSMEDQAVLTSHGLQPGNTKESALVVTLGAGTYTLKLDNGTGVGVIDGFDLSSTAESKIAQISIRAYSQPGNGAIIMGFISRGGQKGVIRGTGTSTLAPFGFSPVIPDPYFSLYDGAGNPIGGNDDWGSDPSAFEIQFVYELAPGDTDESATILNTQKGFYTVVLQGTGYGLLELYNVNPY